MRIIKMSILQKIIGMLVLLSLSSILMSLFVGVSYIAGHNIIFPPAWLWLWTGISGGIGFVGLIGLVATLFMD